MNIGVNKIITLGNGEVYLVVAHVCNNDKNYYYIAECNEDASDIKDNYKIVEESVKDGNTFIDEVVGEANLKSVLPLFVKSIVNN